MTPRFAVGLLLAQISFSALADQSLDDSIKSLEAGIVDLNARGQYAEAVPLAKQVIELRRKKNGANDIDYASALANLAMLDKSLGRFDEAQSSLEQSLAIRRKVLKPSDPLILASLGSLAEIYADEGKPEQAEPLLKEVPGISSPEIAKAADAAGTAYLGQKRYEQAIPLLQRTVDSYRRLYPAGNPRLAAATANLSSALTAAGRTEQAESLLKQAAESGTEDQATIDALTRESDLYVSQNRPDDAAPVLRRVVAIRRKLGTEDKNLAARVGNLAALYANARRYAESVPFWQDNVALFEKVSGPDSANVAFGLDNLAIVYLNQGDLDQAEPAQQRSAAIYLKTGGESDPHYVAAQGRLAKIEQIRKQLEKQQTK